MNKTERIILYYIWMYTDLKGEFVVGRNDIANMLRVTSMTAAKYIKPLVESGLVIEQKKPLARGLGYKWIYRKSAKLIDLVQNENRLDELRQAYDDKRADNMRVAVETARKLSKPRGKAIKRSEKQLSLFGDE